MRSATRAEFLKLRTTSTVLWLALSMSGLVALAVLPHGLGLPPADVEGQPTQMRVFISGQSLGSVFAALAGAVTITGEFRHGTIRPTFLARPARSTVLRAKAAATALVGALLGAVATALAGALTLVSQPPGPRRDRAARPRRPRAGRRRRHRRRRAVGPDRAGRRRPDAQPGRRRHRAVRLGADRREPADRQPSPAEQLPAGRPGAGARRQRARSGSPEPTSPEPRRPAIQRDWSNP